jgi:cytochrome oxidase Cu insertion factor (SCO1/SenC/PrrC family)
MKRPTLLAALLLASAPPLIASGDFPREKPNPAKAALEGKAPPELQVDGWMNTGGAPMDWASLRGKVVVLDFWGTW